MSRLCLRPWPRRWMPQKSRRRDAPVLAGRARSYRSGPDPIRQHRYAARASSNRSPCRSRLCLRPWLRRWIPQDRAAGCLAGRGQSPLLQKRTRPRQTAPLRCSRSSNRSPCRSRLCLRPWPRRWMPKGASTSPPLHAMSGLRPVRPGPIRWLSQPQALRHEPKARPTASCCTNFAPRA